MLFQLSSSSVHFLCYRKQHCNRGGGNSLLICDSKHFCQGECKKTGILVMCLNQEKMRSQQVLSEVAASTPYHTASTLFQNCFLVHCCCLLFRFVNATFEASGCTIGNHLSFGKDFVIHTQDHDTIITTLRTCLFNDLLHLKLHMLMSYIKILMTYISAKDKTRKMFSLF